MSRMNALSFLFLGLQNLSEKRRFDTMGCFPQNKAPQWINLLGTAPMEDIGIQQIPTHGGYLIGSAPRRLLE